MKIFILCLGLVLIFEGITPFSTPKTFRKILLSVVDMSDTTLRIIGFSSILTGLTILYLVKYFFS
jgi:uncharacterized protein YjeT (DUF2065 family)